MASPKIHVIHENSEWVVPLRAALRELSLPFDEWFLDQGMLDFSAPPPAGVFYNRMSASSHTRGHRYAPEYTSTVLAWLESHGRRVVNDHRALALEINKIAQYAELRKYGVRTPRTYAAVGKANIIKAAGHFAGPFITKHNRAGKGLGVRLFQSVDALADYVRGPEFEDSVDGITLVQQYIRAPDPFITRVEFIGGEFLYAVRVDTSLGFELCPADVCQVGDAFCPVGTAPDSGNAEPAMPPSPALIPADAEADPAAAGGGRATTLAPAPAAAPRFRILPDFNHPILAQYQRFLADNGIGVAGIEFITNAAGEVFTYDVNTNTNYNAAAEAEAQKFGMRTIAAYLGRELAGLPR
jgi:hypothetical protein